MNKKFQSSPFQDRYFGCMFEIQANKMLEGALLYRRSVFKMVVLVEAVVLFEVFVFL